ncbi:hypothetical protein SAMN05421821_105135 [Mucilaginibacter lappiensis]|uniref:Uncharacterized protein n=1 Tax=Mucilaginibacter lappiensis TaxID=354630 RepID=A0ABR6PIW4_9SPHI|nr:hypothetical protein [Mucilaginibacter lappiensis]MBB6109717.1 hypothetical protein [Mucilaginibacter lappiensis]SIR12944.1 hypothetical protein SAMN05421821_105135 [Mucilaginibacter lappiensis]
MGLHHATIKAAVKAYGPLHTEGKTADEVKAEIAKDEKGFTPDEVEEVYAAITADPTDDKPESTPKPKKAKAHVVITQFRDKNNWDKLYEVGDDVSHFDDERKADLLDRKLIEAI